MISNLGRQIPRLSVWTLAILPGLSRILTLATLRSVLARFGAYRLSLWRPGPPLAGGEQFRSRSRKFLGEASVLTVGTVIGAIGPLAGAPLLTRVYGPDAIGAWALFSTFALVSGAVLTWKYELAIVLPSRDTVAINVIAISLLSQLVMTIVLVTIFYHAASFFIASVDPDLVLFWLPFMLLAVGFQSVCHYWALRKQAFWAMSTFLVIQPWLVIILQILLGIYSGGKTDQLIAGSVLAYLVASALFAASIYATTPRLLWHYVKPADMYDVARQYHRFAFYSVPYALLAMAANRALILLFAVFTSPASVGFLAIAMRVTSLPKDLISPGFHNAFFRWAAIHIHEPGALEHLTRDILRLKIITGVPAVVLFAMNAPALFGMIFGSQWQQAGVYAALLAAPRFCGVLTNWLDPVYSVLQKQRTSFLLEVSYDVLMFGAVSACLMIGDDPLWAVAAFSVTNVVYNLVWLVVTFWIVGLPIGLLAESVGLVLLMIAIFLAVHFSAQVLLDPLGYALICGAAVLSVWILTGRKAMLLLQTRAEPQSG
jgi:O-antigen/teichoic acid export membrane protein